MTERTGLNKLFCARFAICANLCNLEKISTCEFSQRPQVANCSFVTRAYLFQISLQIM